VAGGATLLGVLQSGPPVFRQERPIAIVGGMLIDATGGPPRHDQAVVIQGNRIIAIGPMETTPVPDGAEVIDAAGMTVMPGLINSNQHIQLNPLFPAPTANLPLEVIKARWARNWAHQPRRAWVYLMRCITRLRHTSGPAKQILPVKHAIDRGEIPGPRVFLGGALFMSDEHFDAYVKERGTPADSMDWMRREFAYNVISDADRDTDAYLTEDFNYWNLYMSDERWNGSNDFTDDELRFMIDKAHRRGKIIDVHAGGHNDGLRRMLAFDVDTLEQPFYGGQLIEMDIIEGYVKKGVIIVTLLTVMVVGAQRALDPHRFNETLYTMSFDPSEHRILMQYRDRMLANLKKPDERGGAIYDLSRPGDSPDLDLPGNVAGENMTTTGRGPAVNEQVRRMQVSKENMRRFIKAGAKFAMGTDTGSFLNFQQEDPNANEMIYMVEMGMPPMQAIEASTRNGAETLGLLDELGTLEPGKLADVIVVAGNPLRDMAAMKRVYAVIKDGVRYK
jgi:imidazolonepropionase-like amidohydrolase